MLEQAAEARNFNGTQGDDEEARVVDTCDNKLVVINNLETEEPHLRQAGYLSQEPEDENRPRCTAA